MSRTRIVPALLGLLALAGCKSEPQTSYCEALCDWAVTCAEGERSVEDAAALKAECLAQAEASDPSCADAAEGLNPVDSKATTECTDAIQASIDAGECGVFTGSIDDIKQGTTPKECATQGAGAQETFEAVRDATAEGNEDLCNRFAETFCGTMATCTEEALGDQISEAIAAVGQDPYDKCMADLADRTGTCVSDGTYAPEEDLTDVNTSRQAARECLADWESVTCDDLTSGSLPPLCAPAVENPTDYADTLLGVLTTYQDAVSR